LKAKKEFIIMGHWITATRIVDATRGTEKRIHINTDRLGAIEETEGGNSILIFEDDVDYYATRGPKGVLVKEPPSHFMALSPQSEYYLGAIDERRGAKTRAKHLADQAETGKEPTAATGGATVAGRPISPPAPATQDSASTTTRAEPGERNPRTAPQDEGVKVNPAPTPSEMQAAAEVAGRAADDRKEGERQSVTKTSEADSAVKAEAANLAARSNAPADQASTGTTGTAATRSRAKP
jgi:hypothetical protein